MLGGQGGLSEEGTFKLDEEARASEGEEYWRKGSQPMPGISLLRTWTQEYMPGCQAGPGHRLTHKVPCLLAVEVKS